MNYIAEVQKKLGLSDIKMGRLFGVQRNSIFRLHKGTRKPGAALQRLAHVAFISLNKMRIRDLDKVIEDVQNGLSFDDESCHIAALLRVLTVDEDRPKRRKR